MWNTLKNTQVASYTYIHIANILKTHNEVVLHTVVVLTYSKLILMSEQPDFCTVAVTPLANTRLELIGLSSVKVAFFMCKVCDPEEVVVLTP